MGMEFWVPLVSALAGALIGSATSIITIWIQGRRDERRHLREKAVELALSDYKYRSDVISKIGGSLYPISLHFAYHLELLEEASKGKLTPEAMQRISDNHTALRDFIDRRGREVSDAAAHQTKK
jgi:hypothetical protein